MAGSGVRATNLEALYLAGIREFHSSASATRPSPMQYRNPNIRMGKEGEVDEYTLNMADEQLVSELRRRLDHLHSSLQGQYATEQVGQNLFLTTILVARFIR